MKMVATLSAAAAIFLFGGIASRADNSDMLYIPFNWNIVAHSKNVLDAVGDCLRRSAACATAIEVASTYYAGTIPGTFVLGATAMEEWGLNPHYSKAGEEHHFKLDIPDGYRACDIGLQEMSAAPSDGKYSPTFSLAVKSDNQIGVYSFVHRMPILSGGGRRSWIDTVVLLQAAKIGSAAEVSCHFQSGSKYSYSCKGSQGTNNGLPACVNKTFGGIALTPPPTPAPAVPAPQLSSLCLAAIGVRCQLSHSVPVGDKCSCTNFNPAIPGTVVP